MIGETSVEKPPKMEEFLNDMTIDAKEHDGLVNFHYSDRFAYIRSYEWTPARQWSRGIVFNKETGEIISAPFRKFFNFSEPNCKITDPEGSILTVKIDGTCIVPYLYNGEVKCKTLNSFENDFSNLALPLVKKMFMGMEPFLAKYTFIFEFLAEQTPLFPGTGSGVLQHKGDPKLILLGTRSMENFALVKYEILKSFADMLKCETMKIVDRSFRDAVETALGDWDGLEEGWVGYSPTGEMFKIKYREYVKAHKFHGGGGHSHRILSIRDIIRFYENNPEISSKIFPMDDILAMLNSEIKRLKDIALPLRAVSWSTMSRAEKKERLSTVTQDLHPIIFGKEEILEDVTKNTAMSNLSRKAYRKDEFKHE